jgi:magnesium transporter
MFTKRFSQPGTAPATLTPLDPGTASKPVFRVIQYGRDQIEESQPTSIAEIPSSPVEGMVRWIDMCGLGDVEALKLLGEKFGLHPLALEDVLHTGQRPKMEPYEGHLFIVAQMTYLRESGQLQAEQVSMFLCNGILITVQEEPLLDVFGPVRERIRAGRGFIRKSGADYLAYALLDAIVDHSFPILEALGESMEVLETQLLAEPSKSCVHQLHAHRRTLMQLRRFVWPERDVLSALLHEESGLIAPQTKIFLRDCYDHSVQIMDLVESYRDVAAGLLEMYLSSVSLKTNEIMRVLTVISSIFIPLTFVAGVYGMNFSQSSDSGEYALNMPELHQPWGYPGCLLLMAAIAVGQILFFKRRKWL